MAASCRQTAPVAPEEPNVVLTSPGNNSTIPAGDITVHIYLENFEVNPDFTQPNKPNQGHVIYYLDAAVPLEHGAAATTEPGSYSISTQTSYTWQNVAAGEHVFWVQLVNNNDTPLLPPVAVRVDVKVR